MEPVEKGKQYYHEKKDNEKLAQTREQTLSIIALFAAKATLWGLNASIFNLFSPFFHEMLLNFSPLSTETLDRRNCGPVSLIAVFLLSPAQKLVNKH